MRHQDEFVERAKERVEGDPMLKRLYQSFRQTMTEREALAAAVGPRFEESINVFSGFGGNR
jgi:ribonucleotide reductase beta subunit family protein with ferritin-like domain